MPSESEYGQEQLIARWFIWLVRVVLVAGAGAALWQALLVLREFERVSAEQFRFDVGKHWAGIGLVAAAGLAFGLALRIPFPRPRTAWGRLPFAVLALVPAVHDWIASGVTASWLPGFLTDAYWFDANEVVVVAAALAGVAVASAPGARRGKL